MSDVLPEVWPTSICPMLSVRDAAAAIAFYRDAFGAQLEWQLDGDNGPEVAEMSIDGARFLFAAQSPEHGNHSPETLGGSTVRIELIVADPDAVFARAVSAGAEEVWAVADQNYNWRQGRIRDPFGHHWLVGKPLGPTRWT